MDSASFTTYFHAITFLLAPLSQYYSTQVTDALHISLLSGMSHLDISTPKNILLSRTAPAHPVIVNALKALNTFPVQQCMNWQDWMMLLGQGDQLMLTIKSGLVRLTLRNIQSGAVSQSTIWSAAEKIVPPPLEIQAREEYRPTEEPNTTSVPLWLRNTMSALRGHDKFSRPTPSFPPQFLSSTHQSTFGESKLTTDSPRLYPGDFQGLFKLVSRGGGYCDVYKASHVKWGSVALKRPRPKGEVDIPRERELYKREADIWKPLWHANIIRFYGWLEVNSEIYLASPWMDHGTLRNFLTRHPGSYRPPFMRQTADGLAYLHRSGIVHGDLKASNILVSSVENAVLCDFGLSKVVEACGTSSEQCAGSARRMNPEILNGKPQSFSSDVYAFGMTMYEILFDLIPFETETDWNDITVIQKVMTENARPSPPKDLPQRLQGRFYEMYWDLAKQCWDADCETRPSTGAIVEYLHSIETPTSTIIDASRIGVQVDDGVSEYWTTRSEIQSNTYITAMSEDYSYDR